MKLRKERFTFFQITLHVSHITQGVLESLGLIGNGGNGAYTVYLDIQSKENLSDAEWIDGGWEDIANGTSSSTVVTNGGQSEVIIALWKSANRVVAQTSKSAVAQVSKPAGRTTTGRSAFSNPADLEIGDTAGLETRATKLT